MPFKIEARIWSFLQKKAVILFISQENWNGLLKYEDNILKGMQRKIYVNEARDSEKKIKRLLCKHG